MVRRSREQEFESERLHWKWGWGRSAKRGSSSISLNGQLLNFVLQLLKLYERNAPETEDDSDYTVADLVHHFLLAICTRPGVGLCFKDRGWYPRDVSGGGTYSPFKPTHTILIFCI